jgi:hypothetical protein
MMELGPAQKAELGAKRCYYRKRLEDYMYRAGFRSCNALAARIGLTGEAVRLTLSGQRHTPVVLDALRDLGVPEKYLFDPRKFADRAA